jgi:hypothetical protein
MRAEQLLRQQRRAAADRSDRHTSPRELGQSATGLRARRGHPHRLQKQLPDDVRVARSALPALPPCTSACDTSSRFNSSRFSTGRAVGMSSSLIPHPRATPHSVAQTRDRRRSRRLWRSLITRGAGAPTYRYARRKPAVTISATGAQTVNISRAPGAPLRMQPPNG